MARIQKYGASEVLPHLRHNKREQAIGYSNDAIVGELTQNNYSLIDRGNVAETNQYRKELEKEIFRFNRKNLVHAVEMVIHCPADCPAEQEEAFFKESLTYVVSTLPMGERCILSADVHRDERHEAPDGSTISKNHMHIMYVPAVPDTKHSGYAYKLSAHDLTSKSKLRAFHPELQRHLNDCGIKATVYSGKNSGGRTVGLSVSQLKEITARTGVVLDKGLTIDQLCDLLKSKDIAVEQDVKSDFEKEFEAAWQNTDKSVEVDKDEDILW